MIFLFICLAAPGLRVVSGLSGIYWSFGSQILIILKSLRA